MKANLHPQVHHDCLVTCVCGNTFVTSSTLPEIRVEICSACHPFYTGEMRFVDTQGRVDKFMKKMAAASSYAPKTKKKQNNAKPATPKTLKEMLKKS